MLKEIFKISNVFSVCGRAIKAIGENNGISKIGENGPYYRCQ